MSRSPFGFRSWKTTEPSGDHDMGNCGPAPDRVGRVPGKRVAPALDHDVASGESATFRTADVVGIDTLVKVAKGVADNCSGDEAKDIFKIPSWLDKIVANNWLGDKTGQGFFKKMAPSAPVLLAGPPKFASHALFLENGADTPVYARTEQCLCRPSSNLQHRVLFQLQSPMYPCASYFLQTRK